MEPRNILINLVVRLGVAAAVSSSLVRSREFKKLVFKEERTFRQKIYLVLWFGLPIMVGVWFRILQKSFSAGDLSLETALLLGVIGGVGPDRWAVSWSACRRCCTESGLRCRSTCCPDSWPASSAR